MALFFLGHGDCGDGDRNDENHEVDPREIKKRVGSSAALTLFIFKIMRVKRTFKVLKSSGGDVLLDGVGVLV